MRMNFKRNIFIMILFGIMLIPSLVFAEVSPKDLEYTDLKATLTAEDIGMVANYSENDNQVMVYLFRGQGCPHCEELLNYINTIVKDYGSKFKLRAFEVWNNENNSEFQQVVSDKLKAEGVIDEDAAGVPFLIIGKTVVYGFDASKDEKTITDAIDREYNSTDRYDVIKDLGYDLSAMKDVSSTYSKNSESEEEDDDEDEDEEEPAESDEYDDDNKDVTNYDEFESTKFGKALAIIGILVSISCSILMIIGMWTIFKKANKPGWHALIPFLNMYDILDMGGINGLYFLLCFIPIVGWGILMVLEIIALLRISKAFGKTGAYEILFVLFTPIMFTIYGLNKDTYDKNLIKTAKKTTQS